MPDLQNLPLADLGRCSGLGVQWIVHILHEHAQSPDFISSTATIVSHDRHTKEAPDTGYGNGFTVKEPW